ncbi:hypothetical protein [Sphingobium arseniciresistens]|uniref:hypothetical protein n=1 Tax=Sphingobium arseniciresistens TaxID=3030834 RepID=UPI0030CA1A87
MDYPARARLKIYMTAKTLALDADPALTAGVCTSHRGARPERIFRLGLSAYDWNCPQHIVPRFTHAVIAAASAPLHERMAALEAENAALRALAAPGVDPEGERPLRLKIGARLLTRPFCNLAGLHSPAPPLIPHSYRTISLPAERSHATDAFAGHVGLTGGSILAVPLVERGTQTSPPR